MHAAADEAALPRPSAEQRVRQALAADPGADTRAQVRTAAAILLSEYGEVPSTRRVRDLIQVGSMSTIQQEIRNFLAEWHRNLQARSLVHGIPQAVVDALGKTAPVLWQIAQEEASRDYQDKLAQHAQDLADMRAQANAATEQALEQVSEAQAKASDAQALADAMSARAAGAEEAIAEQRRAAAALAADRDSLAGAVVSLESQLARCTCELSQLRSAQEDERKRHLLQVDGLRQQLKQADDQRRSDIKGATATLEKSHAREIQQRQERLDDQARQLTSLQAAMAAEARQMTALQGELAAAHARIEELVAASQSMKESFEGSIQASLREQIQSLSQQLQQAVSAKRGARKAPVRAAGGRAARAPKATP